MVYHVSATPGLAVLVPRRSSHGKAFVYAVDNLVTGLLFGVHNFKCKGSLYGRTGGYAHD